jgi:hypothetical protein
MSMGCGKVSRVDPACMPRSGHLSSPVHPAHRPRLAGANTHPEPLI